MTRKELKSEFLKVYYKEQFGENQMLEKYEHEILDRLLEPVFNSENFSVTPITDIEQIFPSIGLAYSEQCKLYENKGKFSDQR